MFTSCMYHCTKKKFGAERLDSFKVLKLKKRFRGRWPVDMLIDVRKGWFYFSFFYCFFILIELHLVCRVDWARSNTPTSAPSSYIPIFVDDLLHYYPSQFEAIPESLKNMLLVMSTAGIFDEEECALTAHSQGESRKTHSRSDSEVHKYSALWQVTWERIDCFLPNLRQELFTPRSQSLPANSPPVKVEQEKLLTEECNPGPDLTYPVDEGIKLLFCHAVK